MSARKSPVAYILDPETGCWVWQLAIGGTGYGTITVNGRTMRAHRVYYARERGDIPEGLVLDHLCRNRRCVNPAHLEPVTDRENILRGEGPPAQNARKTHCPRGHEFTPENTGYAQRGHRRERYCKTCHRMRGAAWARLKRAERRAVR